jgi:uncharacterized protein YbjQ (UPF0145 family)
MAPLRFGSRGPSEDQQSAAAIDLQRIREGGIPLGAEQRLERVGAAKTPFFTSDLSVKEYALAQASGLQPIAQVMGSSVVRHGRKQWRTGRFEQGFTEELTSWSDPWNVARTRAFERLRVEATLAAADAVIGIELSSESVDADGSQLEYAVFGTAARETTLAASGPGRPQLSTLSGQDVDKLRRIGAGICGVVGHTTVLLVGRKAPASWTMGGSRGGNQELTEISAGMYEARRLLMTEIERQAAERGANDVVVTTLRHRVAHHAVEQGAPNQQYFVITMHLLGTALRLGAHEPHPAPLRTPTMSIDLRG